MSNVDQSAFIHLSVSNVNSINSSHAIEYACVDLKFSHYQKLNRRLVFIHWQSLIFVDVNNSLNIKNQKD